MDRESIAKPHWSGKTASCLIHGQAIRKRTIHSIMNHRVIGTTLPVLELQLQPGESVLAVSSPYLVSPGESVQEAGAGAIIGSVIRGLTQK